jgi:glycosyltransferase involved in cell wall biosynthesis
MGGGEQLASAYALALASSFSVELITTSPFDLDLLARRLGKPELSSLSVRLIGDSPTAASEVSAEYDLFLNHSFTSEDVNLSKFGVYVCMFPQAFRRPTPDDLLGRFSCGASPATAVSPYGDSFELLPLESLNIRATRDEVMTFVVDKSAGSIELVNIKKDVIAIRALEGLRREFITLPIPRGDSTLVNRSKDSSIRILSPRLGDGMRVFIEGGTAEPQGSPAFVRSYDLVLSISEFTESFVRERWGTTGIVHYPPVSLRPAAPSKENVILSVGRFFSEDVGHCKQQLRMVHAFRRMVDEGLSDWRLSLVGGCDQQYKEYALEVRRAAHGYPIDVFLNADLEKLDEEFARASIYWHATGLGTDIDKHPDRAEHFGIAPIEAMSTGAIPIVFDFGGPREIVVNEQSGFVFDSVEALIGHTRKVIELTPKARRALSESAILRSSFFSPDRYLLEFDEILKRKTS